jgi:DNA anti-recombination protein RmuC
MSGGITMFVSIESWFNSLPTITQGFVVAIAVLTVLMAGPFYNNRTIHYGPTILTMIGISGCFLGISLGLMDFRTNDIQGSVPNLVDGIRTAFWASVCGVFGALIIKMRLLVFGPPRVSPDGVVAEATVDDLATLLRSLHQSIAGREDSTLLSQTKLLRQENRDGLSSLKSSLDSYMEKIAESNSKALIEALKEVIRDFNAKINEQFGDNFKKLNSAVERILVWQESYRQQMGEMIEQQKLTTNNMSIASERYAGLLQQSESFVEITNSLQSLIQALNLQRDQITQSISALGALLKASDESLPKIETQVIEMTRQITAGAQTSTKQIADAVTATTEALQTAHAEMKRLLIEAANAAHKEVNTTIKSLTETTQRQVTDLDKALSDELTKSIETLGEHLTALSRRFVDDYTPLTERLQTLVQAASRIQ